MTLAQSTPFQLGKVAFPEFNAERIYMQPFTQKDGLPKHLLHWQDTVDQMLHESIPLQQDCLRTVVRLNVLH